MRVRRQITQGVLARTMQDSVLPRQHSSGSPALTARVHGTVMCLGLVLMVLAGGFLLSAATRPPTSHAAPPAGLAAADWHAIQAMLPPSQQAYLKASNTGAGDIFGWSVAVDGDTVVVGAYQEDSAATGVGGDQTNNSASGAGAAYVFTRSDAQGAPAWTQQAYLKATNPDANDNFGWRVAVDGDTIVVGAYREDSAATGVGGDQTNNSAGNSGAAYVFTRSGTTWTPQAYLKASNTGAGDNFGVSVAISGDTVVVGAYQEDS
ncbi:MAG: FG-GAP repeat protein, partial [Herpetosiphonaceae bacterium]|nr:FG-GAP repeat protein [Herpetosiphonaceae bacterium]